MAKNINIKELMAVAHKLGKAETKVDTVTALVNSNLPSYALVDALKALFPENEALDGLNEIIKDIISSLEESLKNDDSDEESDEEPKDETEEPEKDGEADA